MSIQKYALVIGASRGLGLGLVAELANNGWRVLATVRDVTGQASLQKLACFASGTIEIDRLDIAERQNLDNFVVRHKHKTFDLILVNAGVFGPDHQSALRISAGEIGNLIYTNAIAPAQIGQLMLEQIRETTGVLAFTSSVRASIAGNNGGGPALYRVSKAALNTLARSMYPAFKNRGITMLLIHPGWVQTEMGGDGAEVTVADSARGMLQQIEKYAGSAQQYFIDYQGTELPW